MQLIPKAFARRSPRRAGFGQAEQTSRRVTVAVCEFIFAQEDGTDSTMTRSFESVVCFQIVLPFAKPARKRQMRPRHGLLQSMSEQD